MDEMEKLRLQIRDRDLEIIDLVFKLKTANEIIFKMRNCENCINSDWDGEKVSCQKSEKECSLPDLKAWRAQE